MAKRFVSFLSLVLSDLMAIALCFYLAYFIRNSILPGLIESFQGIPLSATRYLMDYSYLFLAWILIFSYERLYTKRFQFWQEIKALIKGTTISSAIAMAIIYVANISPPFSRAVIIMAWFISLFFLPFFRFLVKIILIKAKIWTKKLVIVGINDMSLQVLRNVRNDKTLGYEVAGFIDDESQNIGREFHGVKVLGPISELETISRTLNSKDIMIASHRLSKRDLKELLSRCDDICESMWLIPQSGDIITEGIEIENLGDVCALYKKKNLVKPWNLLIKNLFDRTVALILLLLLFPVLVAIALAIGLESKGPVIYKQKRLGRKKRMFSLYKFRSMYLNNDEILEKYLQANSDVSEEWKKYRKLKAEDPRVTKTGRLIRKFSLDELPQFFNVLIGQMSLVGPRPYLVEELKGKHRFLDTVIRVKPGLTGLWQISGRSELPFAQRINLDEYYINNWTFWTDLVILLKTLNVFFSGKGAY